MMNSKKTELIMLSSSFDQVCILSTNQLINYSTNQRYPGLPRQGDGDRTTGAFIVGSGHGPTHQPDEFSHQSQTNARAAGGSGQRIFDPVKVVKYFFQILARDAGPGVGHHDLHPIPIPAGPDADLALGSVLAEFHAVFNQVD